MVVALDRHKLGMVGGACTATIIMAVCFFWQQADLDATIIRVGWTFVIAYSLFYLFTDRILRVALLEFVIDKKEKEKEKKMRRLGKESADESEDIPEDEGLALEQAEELSEQAEELSEQTPSEG